MVTDGDEQEGGPAAFCVEYSNSPFNDTKTYEKYFTTKAHAQEYAEKIGNQFPCVWLLALGFYRTNDAGSAQKGWISYWWSPGSSEGVGKATRCRVGPPEKQTLVSKVL